MGYRTMINGVQIFGNNEIYEEWIDYIRSQGIMVDSEGCYEGAIYDFMGSLETIEKITLRISMKYDEQAGELRAVKRLFDLSDIPDRLKKQDLNDRFHNSLFDLLVETVKSGYGFMPYCFYLACKDKLEQIPAFSSAGHFYCYKVKDGEGIHVLAK